MLTISLISLACFQTFGPWALLMFAGSFGSFAILMILRRINRPDKPPPDDP